MAASVSRRTASSTSCKTVTRTTPAPTGSTTIGDSFAMLEMQRVVAMVAQRYRPDLVPGHPVAAQPAISLRARYGMRMALEALP